MMQFIVISNSEHGQIIEECGTRAEAERWAQSFAVEGETASVFMKMSEVPAVAQPEDFGVLAGIDFPATLGMGGAI